MLQPITGSLLSLYNDEHRKSKILIVEDDYYGSLALQNIINTLSMGSFAVDSGFKAIEVIKERYEEEKSTFQLILIDYIMPNMNGIDTTYMIRKYLNEVAPDVAQPFIVCMTNQTVTK